MYRPDYTIRSFDPGSEIEPHFKASCIAKHGMGPLHTRRWIHNLQGKLDGDVKRRLQTGEQSGMVKIKVKKDNLKQKVVLLGKSVYPQQVQQQLQHILV